MTLQGCPVVALTRNINGNWIEVLRWVEGMRIQSFPLGESLEFCTHRRNICCFAGHQSAPVQFSTFQCPLHFLCLARLFLIFCFFFLFLPLSSIPVLYSLLLSDTLENIMLVAPMYQALKTHHGSSLLSII